jgi:hypothetical protein
MVGQKESGAGDAVDKDCGKKWKGVQEGSDAVDGITCQHF